PHS
ncbi:hypothetical protein EC34870_2445B, partial [Escherichia coli 3.4870]